ncbi:MAG: reverse transcriptase-like protein [Pseudomonadota bacterium]|nr:reverse transcriptase-like protein [Pseudomonadota bacterium]
MEAAVVVRGVMHLFGDIGFGTSQDAEWLALIRALELAQALGAANFELIGDARGVIEQANLALRTGHGQGHAASFTQLATADPPARIRWIKRSQNLAGIALAAGHPR